MGRRRAAQRAPLRGGRLRRITSYNVCYTKLLRILIPTLLWSLGLIEHIDSLMYRTIWWGFGHSSQQINVAAHVALWYAGAAIVFGAKPLSET